MLAKKGTTEPTSLSFDQALDEALCHGWIDGLVKRRDEGTYRQRFTPRRREEHLVEAEHRPSCERLVTEGRMHPAGIAEVDQAKTDGRWNAS